MREIHKKIFSCYKILQNVNKFNLSLVQLKINTTLETFLSKNSRFKFSISLIPNIPKLWILTKAVNYVTILLKSGKKLQYFNPEIIVFYCKILNFGRIGLLEAILEVSIFSVVIFVIKFTFLCSCRDNNRLRNVNLFNFVLFF